MSWITSLLKWPWINRASPENPQTNLSNPAEWLYDAFGASGDLPVTVNQTTAMHLSAYFAAVRLLSTSIAQLPFHVIKTNGRTKQVASEHPVDYLIHTEPNQTISAFDFRETLMANTFNYGNGYALIERDGPRPGAFFLVDPRLVEPYLEGNILKYRIGAKTPQSSARTVLSDDMIHVSCFGWDGLRGKSIIEYASGDLSLSLAAQKMSQLYYSQGGNIGAWIEHPSQLGDAALKRLQQSVDKRIAGIDNVHKVKVLEEGMKYHRVESDAEKSQMLEARKMAVTEVARWFNLPPHMIGDLEKATFSNINAQDLSYVKHSLMPWVIKVEQAFNRKVFLQSEKSTHFTRMNLDGLLRADIETRAKVYQMGILTGWMSRNEAREKEDMNPVDGLDEFLSPMNMNNAENNNNTNS